VRTARNGILAPVLVGLAVRRVVTVGAHIASARRAQAGSSILELRAQRGEVVDRVEASVRSPSVVG